MWASSAGRISISSCFQHGLQDGYLSLKPHVKGGLFPLISEQEPLGATSHHRSRWSREPACLPGHSILVVYVRPAESEPWVAGSLLGIEMVMSRISYVDKLRTDCSSCWWHRRKGHRSVEGVISIYRGTGAVPVADTDSGEAHAVPRLTKRALVISRETCESVKNIVQIQFPLRNGMRALLTELTDGVPSIKRYYWRQFLVLVIIALIKAFLLIHSILYQNKSLSAVVFLYPYT